MMMMVVFDDQSKISCLLSLTVVPAVRSGCCSARLHNSSPRHTRSTKFTSSLAPPTRRDDRSWCSSSSCCAAAFGRHFSAENTQRRARRRNHPTSWFTSLLRVDGPENLKVVEFTLFQNVFGVRRTWLVPILRDVRSNFTKFSPLSVQSSMTKLEVNL